MAETTSATTSKGKPKPVAIGATGSELPKFEMPRFEMPKFEIPTAFREFAEKGIAQARENYEKAKTAAEEATDVFEDTYSTATKGCASYGLKLIETTRANSDAAFDLMSDVMNAKSYSEVVELYSAYLRKQFDTLVTQSQGPFRARSESGDGNRRADQRPLHQRPEQGGLRLAPFLNNYQCLRPGPKCPGFCFAHWPGALAKKAGGT